MKSNHLLIILIISVVMCLVQLPRLFFVTESPVIATTTLPTILIDAGHGGEDGGAVSAAGDVESHINLAIALKLETLLLFYGIEPVLLREDDVALHDEGIDTVKARKTSDLKNRVELVNQYEDGFLLSIHQNFFTESQYSGAQVFYTDDSQETQEFATELQTLFRDNLNPDNNRPAKVVDSGIYLLNHVQVPALLIECGFLSNEEEAKRLVTSDYQQSIACILTAALLQKTNTLI